MQTTSNEIFGNKAKELKEKLARIQELRTIQTDLKEQLKPVEEELKELTDFVISESKAGLNETVYNSWKLQINKDSESIAPKEVKEKDLTLYEVLKAKGFVKVKKGAKSIKDITKK